MRILILTQYFWPENFKINDIALALKERGHEVMILTGKPNYPKDTFSQSQKVVTYSLVKSPTCLKTYSGMAKLLNKLY